MMRDYSKISPQFWLCDIGRKLRVAGPEAQLIALYLMSSPHSTMTGIYYIPYLLMAHETGLTEEKVRTVIQQLIECQFCSYDEQYEYVWVHEMARCQIAPQLKANDNRVKTVNKFLTQVPKLSFLDKFYEEYKDDFHLKISAFPSEITVSLKEEKVYQEPLDTSLGIAPSSFIAVQPIFDHWQHISQQETLTLELCDAIHRALINGFTCDELNRVCDICIERNPNATEFELLHLLSQRALINEALGKVYIQNQWLDSFNGANYGTESSSQF